MRASVYGHCVFGVVATGAILTGCGGSQLPGGPQGGGAGADPNVLPYHHTFYYTGREQSFKVPAGVNSITVVARGGAGAGYSYKGSYGYHEYFGKGGRVFAIIPVKPDETLYVFVGGKASSAGGFNGGGNGGSDASGGYGYGGGGASDVREGGDALSDRVLVAGGGGGQGSGDYNRSCFGGKGGGATGGSGGGYYSSGGYGGGGTGGTQDRGGLGGSGGQGSGSLGGEPGASGSFGRGGNGGDGGVNSDPSGYNQGGGGGGAGGGYYGGGGGGGGTAEYASIYGNPGGGGGGGSSYIEPSARKFESWQGWKNATGNGLVVFSWK